MSWKEETDKLFETWAEAQQNLWRTWTPDATKKTPVESWNQVLELWQQSWRQAVDSQTELMNLWASEGQLGGASKPDLSQYLPVLQDMFLQWSTAQQQLWGQWLDSMKGLDPGKLNEAWQKQGEQLMEQFSSSAKQIMDAQQEAMDQLLDSFRS